MIVYILHTQKRKLMDKVQEANKADISTSYLKSQGYTEGRKILFITISEFGLKIDDADENILLYKLPADLEGDYEAPDEDEFIISDDHECYQRIGLYTDSLAACSKPEDYFDKSTLMDPISNRTSVLIAAHSDNVEGAIEFVKKIYEFIATQFIDALTKRAEEYRIGIETALAATSDNAKRPVPPATKVRDEMWQREFQDGVYRVSLFSVDENYDGDYNPSDNMTMHALSFRFDKRDPDNGEWREIEGTRWQTKEISRISDGLASMAIGYLIRTVGPTLEGGNYKDACEKGSKLSLSNIPTFV